MTGIKIIVASHGSFAKELIKSAEMIAGSMENIEAFSLMPQMEPDELREQFVEVLDNDSPTIALVDLFGGTPANVVSSLVQSHEIHIVTGVSLPMLLELYFNASQNQFETIEELVENTINTGIEGIKYINELLINNEKEDEND